MTGPSKKRQWREEYRKATALQLQQQQQAQTKPQSSSTAASTAHANLDNNGSSACSPNASVTTAGQVVPIAMPKKKFYRQRAHANPFSDHALIYPASPDSMDWSTHYPAFITKSEDSTMEEQQEAREDSGATSVKRRRTSSTAPVMRKDVEIADIGCGFGGLIVALSPLFPETLMIGMELRNQVTDYVVNRVAALRSQNSITSDASPPPPYHNISAVRSNTMKFLPNYFYQHQLNKIFLCFPDPHFKQRKHKARIVSAQLNAEYAYVVRPGGKVYTITDVEELHHWMVKHFEGEEAGDIAELWERVGQEELDADPCVKVMSEETEEGKKVTRNKGNKYVAVFRRKENPEWPD